jgi:hypothetical protein
VGDAALVGHRDLAVEDERRQRGGDQLVERQAEQRGAVMAVAADQPQPTAGDDGKQPVPVVFDLVLLRPRPGVSVVAEAPFI